jgi:plastocyanin
MRLLRSFRVQPHLSRRSLLIFLVALTGLFVWRVGLTSAGGGPDKKSRTYTVLVGAEDVTQGASIVGFFPDTLTIHVGDTVHWQRNTDEIHTVTVLAGTPLPPLNVPAPPGLPSNLMRNPLIAYPVAPEDGLYDGTTFATSGIFGPDADQYNVDAFDLTFTTPGTYDYVCVVHGARMSGQIIVVDDHERIPPPHQVARQARAAIAAALAQVPDAVAQAEAEVPPPTLNDDGTTTYYVLVAYTAGDQLDLLRFFPDNLTVQPGDTVEWVYNLDTMTMVHTISFLNGTPPPDDLIPVPQDDGPPLLVVNPEIVYPQNADQPLTDQGVYSSGQLRLADPPPTFSLVIGDINGVEPYSCLIHDGSGMLGTLNIVPR